MTQKINKFIKINNRNNTHINNYNFFILEFQLEISKKPYTTKQMGDTSDVHITFKNQSKRNITLIYLKSILISEYITLTVYLLIYESKLSYLFKSTRGVEHSIQSPSNHFNRQFSQWIFVRAPAMSGYIKVKIKQVACKDLLRT